MNSLGNRPSDVKPGFRRAHPVKAVPEPEPDAPTPAGGIAALLRPRIANGGIAPTCRAR